MPTCADHVIASLKASGARRLYGLPGDSLNGLTEAIRRDDGIDWVHVRHEESAALAAAAEAGLTGEFSVCVGSCGPGNLHLINGLFDAQRSRVPVLAIAAQIPGGEVGSGYFQETRPQELFADCSVYAEVVTSPEHGPRILEMAMRAAVERRGVAVVVVPGEVFLGKTPRNLAPTVVRPARTVVRPDDEALREKGAFAHEGPALVEVMTARQELSVPPAVTVEQAKGFTLYAIRTILSGRGEELVDLVTTNVSRRILH
ncbi:thiamine pyrophosphate-binding protein [Streptomyces sp. NPDC001292]|uniref:thiamine pyrophosphate-binding protein n=1 Tax=Streptomyces sp. NPDC001292 TaxID=3364558 RepID=UPI0036849BDA